MNHTAGPGTGVQWNSIHGDMRNSDGFAYPTTTHYALAWRALEGAAVLFGPAVDAVGNLYVCSGRGSGTAHLHSFSSQGELRWEAPIHEGMHTLGPRVVPFAPLLDESGAVYVADEHHFWCFDDTGRVRWCADLAALGVRDGFASAIFSAGGLVGGLALDGTALLLERESGVPAYAPMKLPVGAAPTALETPAGLWHGMMDPATRDAIFPAFFGSGFPLTNTPAVSAQTGMIYITAAGSEAGRTRLFGIREGGRALEIGLQTGFDGYCAVTPSISNDGLTIYTGNHRGELMAFDALNGALRWSYAPAATAASPTVGPDGTVYSGCTVSVDGPSQLSAIDPDTGAAKWRRNYDALASALLPERAPLAGLFPDPQPHASINSVPSVSETHVLVVLTLGYTFSPPGRGPMTQPHRSVLASIDPASGDLLGYTELPDSSEAAVVLSASGSLYTPHAALTSSLFHALNSMLPQSHRTPLRPRGGFSALRPAGDPG